MREAGVSKIYFVITVIMLISAASVGVFYLSKPPVQTAATTASICSNCFLTQPVVEVIVPQLVTHSNQNGAVNSPLNVTRGQTLELTVVIYPTVSVDVKLAFRASAISNADAFGISASFHPSNLSASAQENASSILKLLVASNASVGAYSAVLSAEDLQNSSWVWGTEFQINVQT